ncbi:MAG: GNAT family N-acetyltransferase, partial [Paracoccaceae bacterium]
MPALMPGSASASAPQFSVRLAQHADEVRAAQRLRYDVFVRELGSTGPLVDHDAGIEADRFDPFFDHLLLLDHARATDPVVGVYRLMTPERAAQAGQFYSEDEYDLGPLRRSGLRLLELGRSCLHRDYRGGAAMFHMWQALAEYVDARALQVLFGVASFHGTDLGALVHPLANLNDRHLAPPDLRVRARSYTAMDRIAP